MKQFYERLKELRNERKLSQKALSELLYVSQQTVAKWEKNNSTPNPDAIIKICNVFNCSSDYLLGISDDNKKFDVNLTAKEKDLLVNFRKFNETGQKQLLNYIDFLLSSEDNQYIKNNQFSNADKNEHLA